MHCVCLGVVHRMLYFLKGSINGTNKGKLSTNVLQLISTNMLKFKGKLSSEYVRQPRSLSYLERWKATELSSFLLVTGIVALKGILAEPTYKHFLSLSIAMRMLCESNYEERMRNVDSTQLLLKYYVHNAVEHYGPLFCVLFCVLHFKSSLYEVSAFPFENYLQTLKRLVRGNHNPLVQVCKWLDELSGSSKNKRVKNTFKVSAGQTSNSWFFTNQGIINVRDIRVHGMDCYLYKFPFLDNFFYEFVNSSDIGVFLIRQHIQPSQCWLQKTDLIRKCVCFPCETGKVVIRLLHDFVIEWGKCSVPKWVLFPFKGPFEKLDLLFGIFMFTPFTKYCNHIVSIILQFCKLKINLLWTRM